MKEEVSKLEIFFAVIEDIKKDYFKNKMDSKQAVKEILDEVENIKGEIEE